MAKRNHKPRAQETRTLIRLVRPSGASAGKPTTGWPVSSSRPRSPAWRFAQPSYRSDRNPYVGLAYISKAASKTQAAEFAGHVPESLQPRARCKQITIEKRIRF